MSELYTIEIEDNMAINGNLAIPLQIGVRESPNFWIDTGIKLRGHIEADTQEAYQKGLEAAWECIKKIQDMPKDVRVEIFDSWSTYNIIQNHTGYEVMTKIKAYEEQKDKIRVWDEVVYHDGTKAITLDVSLNDVWSVITENECVEEWSVDKFKKTGRHYDQITEVLKMMRGE